MYLAITTVVQPIHEMGKVATQLLVKKIQGHQLKEEHYRLPISIIERNTTN